MTETNETREDADLDSRLRDAVTTALDDALLCTRVWEAWSFGTMTDEDFAPAAEDPEFVEQIMQAVRPFAASRTVETAEEWAVEFERRAEDVAAAADRFAGYYAGVRSAYRKAAQDLREPVPPARALETAEGWEYGAEVLPGCVEYRGEDSKAKLRAMAGAAWTRQAVTDSRAHVVRRRVGPWEPVLPTPRRADDPA